MARNSLETILSVWIRSASKHDEISSLDALSDSAVFMKLLSTFLSLPTLPVTVPQSKRDHILNFRHIFSSIDNMGVSSVFVSADDFMNVSIESMLTYLWSIVDGLLLPQLVLAKTSEDNRQPREILLSWVRDLTSSDRNILMTNFHSR
jgi:hypothetical protein